jgi:hypothetical protein
MPNLKVRTREIPWGQVVRALDPDYKRFVLPDAYQFRHIKKKDAKTPFYAR